MVGDLCFAKLFQTLVREGDDETPTVVGGPGRDRQIPRRRVAQSLGSCGRRESIATHFRCTYSNATSRADEVDRKERVVRLGYFLPHLGPAAGPDSITQVAERAEQLGFDSLWVAERSLMPIEPKTPYPLGELPSEYRIVLDALTFAAAKTSRVALGMG